MTSYFTKQVRLGARILAVSTIAAGLFALPAIQASAEGSPSPDQKSLLRWLKGNGESANKNKQSAPNILMGPVGPPSFDINPSGRGPGKQKAAAKRFNGPAGPSPRGLNQHGGPGKHRMGQLPPNFGPKLGPRHQMPPHSGPKSGPRHQPPRFGPRHQMPPRFGPRHQMPPQFGPKSGPRRPAWPGQRPPRNWPR